MKNTSPVHLDTLADKNSLLSQTLLGSIRISEHQPHKGGRRKGTSLILQTSRNNNQMHLSQIARSSPSPVKLNWYITSVSLAPRSMRNRDPVNVSKWSPMSANLGFIWAFWGSRIRVFSNVRDCLGSSFVDIRFESNQAIQYTQHPTDGSNQALIGEYIYQISR